MKKQLIIFSLIVLLSISFAQADLIDYTTDNSLFLKFTNQTNEATALLDLSPNGNDGTNNGATWSTGVGFAFDGTNDNVSVADNTNLDLNSADYVMCSWWKYDVNGVADNRFISKGASNNGGFGFGKNLNDDPDFFAGTASFIQKRRTAGDTDLTQQLFCIVLDRTDATKTLLYKNGVAMSGYSHSQVDTTDYSNAYPLFLGADANGYTQGDMSAVYIWKSATIADSFNSTVMSEMYGFGEDWNPYAAEPGSDEIFPQVIEAEQDLNLTINSNLYQEIFTEGFQPVNSSLAYHSWVLQLESVNKDTVATCKAEIDGVDYDTETNVSMLTGEKTIMYLYSDDLNVTAGTNYTAIVSCKRDATGGAKLSISEVEGQITLLTHDDGTLLNNLFGEVTTTLASSSFVEIYSQNFTTSNYTGTGLELSLVTDGDSSYTHTSTGLMELYIEVDGVASAISEKYGTAGQVNNGAELGMIKNVTANTNVTVKLFARSTTSDGSIHARFNLVEIFTHPYEAAINNLSNTAITTGTWATIDTLYINNSGHTTKDIAIKTEFNVESLSGSQQLFYRIKSGTTFSQQYTLDINTVDHASAVEHHLITNPGNVNTSIELQAYTTTANANITHGSIMAYIVNEVSATSQFYEITARNVYDNASITTFNVTNAAGTIFESNATGSVNVFHVNGLDNFTTSATGYFNTSTLNHNTSTNATIDMIQSYITFNVTELITNNTATGTITIGATTLNSNETWNLPTGSYSATFAGSGYFSAVLAFNVSALDIVTQNITVSGSIINVTATQAYTGTVLENFTVSWVGTNITYTGNATASGSSYSIPALIGYGYNITVSKTGFITKSTVYTTPTNLTSAAFTLYATNHIEITFYDEETRLVVTDVNYTLTSSDFGFIGTTSNGSISFIDLETDRFNLAYTSINYTDRNHIFNIPSVTDSQTNRSIYLLLDASADDFVLTVQNKLGQTVEGLTASLLRQYVVNNQTVYEVVEMMSPSVALDGATRFTAVPNYVPYLFRVQDANQNILFQGSGTTSDNFDTLFLIDSQISIKVDVGTSPFELSELVDGFQFTLQNSSTRFWFSYDDTQSAFSSYGLKVFANGTDYVGGITGTSSSAILSVYYTYDNQTSYRAVAYGVDPDTGLEVLIDTIVMDRVDKPGVEIFGILSWFILFLSLIVFTIGLASNLTLAILFDILAIIAFSSTFIGIIAISLPVQSGLFIAGLVVVYLMRNN